MSGVREEVRRHGSGPHAWRRVERSHGPGGPPGAKIRRLATRHNVARVLATGQGSKVGFVAGRERERKGIVVLATPDGWRHSVLTLDGGMFCGRLAEVPVDAGPAEARAAAVAMVVGLACDVHGVRVDVTWDPSREPGSWTGQVTVAAPPPKAGG